MTHPHFSWQSLAFLGGTLLAVYVSTLAAHAEDCRNLQTVKDSAVLEDNKSLGGHVAKHIHERPADPEWDYSKRDQFQTEADYKRAWEAFRTAPIGRYPDCTADGPDSAGKTIGISELRDFSPVPYRGFKCGSDAWQCGGGEEKNYTRVQFEFNRKGARWVLNSAYPME